MNLLYEDQDLIVVEKPSGLAVESRKISSPDLISLLRNHLSTGGGVPYVGMIHRLDQPVQGILVFAKNKTAAASLSAQVQDGRMEKYYLAVVEGTPDPKQGALEHYLLKDGRTNTSRAVPKGTKDAKLSRLTYEVLGEQDGLSLVRIHLLTGRHHQIRAQFSAVGCPLFGDGKYGAKKTREAFPASDSEECGAKLLASPSQRSRGGLPDSSKGYCGGLFTPGPLGSGLDPSFSGGSSPSRENSGIALSAVSLSFLHPRTRKRLSFAVRPAQAVFQKFSGLL